MDAYYKPETRFLKLYNGKVKQNNILNTEDIPGNTILISNKTSNRIPYSLELRIGSKPKRHIYDKRDLLSDYQK